MAVALVAREPVGVCPLCHKPTLGPVESDGLQQCFDGGCGYFRRADGSGSLFLVAPEEPVKLTGTIGIPPIGTWKRLGVCSECSRLRLTFMPVVVGRPVCRWCIRKRPESWRELMTKAQVVEMEGVWK